MSLSFLDADGKARSVSTTDPLPVVGNAAPGAGGDASAANQTLQLAQLQEINADLGAPSAAAATSDDGTFGLLPLIKRLLGKLPALVSGRIPVDHSAVIQLGSGAVTASTQRVVLASDGPTVTTLTSIDNKTPAPRTPTTTSVASSATSVTLLASNANRRGVTIANDSTSVLRVSFSTPATAANAFVVVPAGGFLVITQQLLVTSAIYGIWASANGTAQVTEYV